MAGRRAARMHGMKVDLPLFMNPQTPQGLLDALVFASQSRGDSDDELARMLARLVAGAAGAEAGRREAAGAGGADASGGPGGGRG